jgi:transposase
VATHRTDLATEATLRWPGCPWQDTRAVLNGILWVLGTGAQWRELPKKHPPYQTCHRRFQQWVREGKLERILRGLAEELQARGKLQLEEAFIDASFTGAKKGASRSGPPNAARDENHRSRHDHSLPLAISIESASPHESQLVEGVLGHSFPDTLPTRLVGDKAYDSDRLDRDLAERYGIEMIAPHRGERANPHRTVAHCGGTAGVGEWNDSLLGCITFVDW